MIKQYWIDDFFIDLSRNQITQNSQSQTIPPKALAVLTCLAENQGQVISQDVLLNKVWHDTVVSPNTLQRSIAQLRKALNDDGKVQTYIKTHAKQGYSLESDVRWQPSAGLNDSNSTQESIVGDASTRVMNNDSSLVNKPNILGSRLGQAAIVIGLVVLSVMVYKNFLPEPSSQIKFDNLRSLTATDDKEFDASYTPDGEYIVFNRYLDKLCVNKLWAKNIKTQQEIQLTKEWGAYGRHSFSKDGKNLVFLATEACDQPVTQKNCYDLVSLDFEKALEKPREPDLILQCQNSKVKKPTWLNNNDIALLQRQSNHWKLINYSISDNVSTDLYELQDGGLVDFAYSAQDDLIAVISTREDDQDYIDIIKPDGQILSSHVIERPPEISKFRLIYPSFDHINKQLIFSTGRQMFTLSYDGQVSKINVPFADKVSQPVFHPDGKKILLLKGPYDSDIVLLARDQITPEKSVDGQTEAYVSYQRSNLGEDYAAFQPNGGLVAFWSERSGEEQLWISGESSPKQLSQFPLDTYVRGIDWAADGKSLLVNANFILTKINLDSSQVSFPLDYPVFNLYQWDSKNNTALLLVRIKGVLKVVEYDLESSEVKEIADKPIIWALKSEDGQLIYKDHLDRFWRPGAVEAHHIEALDGQGGRAKSFVIKGNVIYAINEQNQLWSYDLDSDAFNIIGEVDKDVDYLTDINQTELLMTIKVSAKKEIVEITLSE